jgi:hypothetical protein
VHLDPDDLALTALAARVDFAPTDTTATRGTATARGTAGAATAADAGGGKAGRKAGGKSTQAAQQTRRYAFRRA